MPSSPTDERKHDILRAWFLGSRAENAELLERLLTGALRDHVFWRRNHHPEDGFTIRELDKRREGYDEAVAEQLGRMMGYDAERSWGHPTSGGTVANFEALKSAATEAPTAADEVSGTPPRDPSGA